MRPLLKNIFLADDDSDDVYFFRYVLESICPDCRLTVFANGEELLNNLIEGTSIPDILFVDVNMPILSGLEALQMIKGLPAVQSVPIIVYSTSKNDDDILKAIQFGASFYIIKPSDMGGLKKLIEKILTFDWKNSQLTPQPDDFVLRA